MRTVFISLFIIGLAMASSETAFVDGPDATGFSPSYLTSYCLSHDNGNITSAWVYINGAGTYAGVQYDTPFATPWLYGIGYYVWSQGWPDSVYQGYSVGCWAMQSGTPGDVIWPADGNPIYNPNTGGNWIFQPVDPKINLAVEAPNGFLVGVGFLYSYPANDALGIDNTGVGPYDWAMTGGTWQAAPYGKQAIRAYVDDIGNPAVETTTMGLIRALYH